MNTYEFSGYSHDEIHINSSCCEIHSFDFGVGFKAQVRASSLRRAQVILERLLADYSCSFDDFYYVTNSAGKKSFRIIRKV